MQSENKFMVRGNITIHIQYERHCNVPGLAEK